MDLNNLLNTKHQHYVVGYIENGEFWCVQQSSSLEKAMEYLEMEKQIFAGKNRQFLLFKKEITYSQVMI